MTPEDSSPPEDDSLPPLAEFVHLLDTKPEFAATLIACFEATLALPHSPETETMQASAAKGLAALKHRQSIYQLNEILKKFAALVREMEVGDCEAAAVALDALGAEAVDHLLDVREPERTRYITHINKLRDEVKRLRRQE